MSPLACAPTGHHPTLLPCRCCRPPAPPPAHSLPLQVSYMASFNTSAFPDSLALGKAEALLIGTIDEIQVLLREGCVCVWGGGGGC